MIAPSGNVPDLEGTIKVLSTSPSVLTEEDVDDFCQLASYYSERTPASFKRDLAAVFYSGTMHSTASKLDMTAQALSQSFCLKVSH